MCRLVQANLHGNLHHYAAQHECGVHDCPMLGQGPVAEETQRFDHVVICLTFDRLPYQIRQRILETVEQAGVAGVVPCADADDGPEKQFIVLCQDFFWRAQWVEERQEAVVAVEEFGEQLGDLDWRQAEAIERVHHGRTAAQVQQRGCSDLLVLRLQESIVLVNLDCAWSEWRVLGRLLRRVDHGQPIGGATLVHGQTAAQLLHLALHLSVAGALANALEVGLDDAFQALLLTSRAAHERVLLDVASELPTVSEGSSASSSSSWGTLDGSCTRMHAPSAGDTRCRHASPRCCVCCLAGHLLRRHCPRRRWRPAA